MGYLKAGFFIKFVMMRNHFSQGIFSLVKKVTDHAVGFRDIMDKKQ